MAQSRIIDFILKNGNPLLHVCCYESRRICWVFFKLLKQSLLQIVHMMQPTADAAGKPGCLLLHSQARSGSVWQSYASRGQNEMALLLILAIVCLVFGQQLEGHILQIKDIRFSGTYIYVWEWVTMARQSFKGIWYILIASSMLKTDVWTLKCLFWC